MTVRENMAETNQYLSGYLEARQAVDAGLTISDEITGQERIDFLTSCRNRCLGGSGLKAAYLGTIASEPTVTVEELVSRGIQESAAMQMIAERDILRQEALGLI